MSQNGTDQEALEDWIDHRFRTIEKLSRTHAQGMAALNAEQQQTQTVITQLVQRVNQIDDFAKDIDLRLTTIADGVAGRYEGTIRDISQRLFALEWLARAARQQPQPTPQPPPPQGPPSYDIGSPVAEGVDRPVPESPEETPWHRLIR